MDKHFVFDRNLLSLSRAHAGLCSRLSAAQTTLGRYRFVESQKGKPLPAWVDTAGCAHTLHSLASPEKEAERLVSTAEDAGFIVFLGLGAGYYAQAALSRPNVEQVIVIDFDIDSVAELLCHHDYISLFNDERFLLLVDPEPDEVRETLLELYQPALHGGLVTLPLRARTGCDSAHFMPAVNAIKLAVESTAEDYSVQSCFGKRWFSNIIHNCVISESQNNVLPPVSSAAVCAAGPSLDAQIPLIKKERSQFYLIATDTSLPSLLYEGIVPDGVISIDCQHISVSHFMGTDISKLPLFLDLASPPLIARRSGKTFFFSGGHPLTNYISLYYRNFPVLDTSGANVTYAGITLAEKMGARRIRLFGADYSYPKGAAYSRGAYFYPFFMRRQNRVQPSESLLSAFLYKSPSLERIKTGTTWYYETKSLGLYRKRLEEKSHTLNAALFPAKGEGAVLAVKQDALNQTVSKTLNLFASGKALCGASDFLAGYRRKITGLPVFTANIARYIEKLTPEQKQILVTMLPVAAALRYRENALTPSALLTETRNYCASKIERLLKTR